MNKQLTRRNNLLNLYVEFRDEWVSMHPTDSGRGVDSHFAEKIQIAKASLSTMKSGGRAIGDKLARQFEVICSKPSGWMDVEHLPNNLVEDGRDLKAFLKLAKKVFEAANERKRAELYSILRSCLTNT